MARLTLPFLRGDLNAKDNSAYYRPDRVLIPWCNMHSLALPLPCCQRKNPLISPLSGPNVRRQGSHLHSVLQSNALKTSPLPPCLPVVGGAFIIFGVFVHIFFLLENLQAYGMSTYMSRCCHRCHVPGHHSRYRAMKLMKWDFPFGLKLSENSI